MDETRKCFICKEIFTDVNKLYTHFFESVTCENCTTFFHTKKEFQQHICLLRCFVCKATFTNRNDFRTHFFDSTTCDTCRTYFHTRKEFDDHICTNKREQREQSFLPEKRQQIDCDDFDDFIVNIPEKDYLPPENRSQVHIDNRRASNHDHDDDDFEDFIHNIPEMDYLPPVNRNQVGRGNRKALNGVAHIETFTPTNEYDLLMELKEKEAAFKQHLKSKIDGHGVKWYIIVCAIFSRETPDENGEIKRQIKEYCVSTETYTAFNEVDIDEQLPLAYIHLNMNCEEAEREGTGWNLEKILRIEIYTVANNPLAASSYIPLPKKVQLTKGVLNIQNEDNCCFIWCILAHLHPIHWTNHANRVNKYEPYRNELDTTGLEFPTPLRQISSFEKRNKLRINVFAWEEKELVPLRVSKERDIEPINLLLISELEKSHYCLIRNFSRLVNYRTKRDGREYFCYNCIHACNTQAHLDKHLEYCLEHKAQKLSFPDDPIIRFKAVEKTMRIPFIIYADTECCTEKHEGAKYQHHRVNSFAFKTVSEYEQRDIVMYRGVDAGKKLVEALVKERDRILKILKNPAPMIFTPENMKSFDEATTCYICKRPFDENCYIKVRDHDHVSGKYRGAAHNPCNLNFRFKKTQQKKSDSFVIPVVFHNLRGYDGHIIMQEVGKCQDEKLSVIANTLEKYISFSVGQLRFIDSFQFMSTSLQKLVNNLSAEGKGKFKNVTAEFPDIMQQDLLLRKGVYPYDYMDNPSKFAETQLPGKEDFYSELCEQGISDEDYAHAQKVWDVFHCSNFGDYHDIYLKSDVLSLTDVFENFRNVCMSTYGLDPAHYYTAPGLSWDSMLKYSGVHLELITDKDKYLMIEKGVRGGISVISQKFAKANNPYMKDYDETKPTNYQMYYDANNLYGWAMSQPLPMTEFQWVEEPEKIDFMNIAEDAEKGYILEVDLHYPHEIHDEHNDYPMAPEPLTIPIQELSDHSKKLRKDLNMTSKPTEKLTPNLKDKKNYVLHYRNLQQYVRHGLKVTKIHRVLQFQQSAWLKNYIALNTTKRKAAKNPFEKDFFKLMNNAIFGKTMENVRKRKTVELVSNDRRMKRVVAKPTFHRFKIFNEDLVGVHLLKCKLDCNKPIQVGLSILDLSKTLMYEFHYDYMKKKYSQCRLLFTDTDSLCYDIQTKDIYEDMKEDADLFDTSDYPKEHFLYSDVNKKVVGKMKDECAGVPIEEFVGLRSKMYSLLYGGKEKRTAKGITRTCQRKMKHQHYKDCLFNRKQTVVEGRMILSESHELYTVKKTKIALSPYDDKRYVMEDGHTTLAHGHYKI